jgi:putative component of membrane protein insertase Oxa1/YidC/SpoIIIJ protein YidD
MQALDQHGTIKGLWLTIKRVSRCHPWGDEGHDPVPSPSQQSNTDLDANE